MDSIEISLEIENLNLRRLLQEAGIQAAEYERADHLQRLVMQELHHRIKNTLATVGAITSQSLRNATSIEEAKLAIDNRLSALGRVHDLLLSTNGGPAKLNSIIAAAIEPFEEASSRQFVIEQSDIHVRADAVLPLSMALNELATNAIKYGALSRPGGRVVLEPRALDDLAVLKWTEQGGPHVTLPKRRGFGLRLIEVSIVNKLQGSSKIDFPSSGVLAELVFPRHDLRAG